MPWWWLKALLVNCRSETTAPAWWNGRITRRGGWLASPEAGLGAGRAPPPGEYPGACRPRRRGAHQNPLGQRGRGPPRPGGFWVGWKDAGHRRATDFLEPA